MELDNLANDVERAESTVPVFDEDLSNEEEEEVRFDTEESSEGADELTQTGFVAMDIESKVIKYGSEMDFASNEPMRVKRLFIRLLYAVIVIFAMFVVIDIAQFYFIPTSYAIKQTDILLNAPLKLSVQLEVLAPTTIFPLAAKDSTCKFHYVKSSRIANRQLTEQLPLGEIKFSDLKLASGFSLFTRRTTFHTVDLTLLDFSWANAQTIIQDEILPIISQSHSTATGMVTSECKTWAQFGVFSYTMYRADKIELSNSVDSLSQMLNFGVLQSRFSQMFSNTEVSTETVAKQVKAVLSQATMVAADDADDNLYSDFPSFLRDLLVSKRAEVIDMIHGGSSVLRMFGVMIVHIPSVVVDLITTDDALDFVNMEANFGMESTVLNMSNLVWDVNHDMICRGYAISRTSPTRKPSASPTARRRTPTLSPTHKPLPVSADDFIDDDIMDDTVLSDACRISHMIVLAYRKIKNGATAVVDLTFSDRGVRHVVNLATIGKFAEDALHRKRPLITDDQRNRWGDDFGSGLIPLPLPFSIIPWGLDFIMDFSIKKGQKNCVLLVGPHNFTLNACDDLEPGKRQYMASASLDNEDILRGNLILTETANAYVIEIGGVYHSDKDSIFARVDVEKVSGEGVPKINLLMNSSIADVEVDYSMFLSTLGYGSSLVFSHSLSSKFPNLPFWQNPNTEDDDISEYLVGSDDLYAEKKSNVVGFLFSQGFLFTGRTAKGLDMSHYANLSIDLDANDDLKFVSNLHFNTDSRSFDAWVLDFDTGYVSGQVVEPLVTVNVTGSTTNRTQANIFGMSSMFVVADAKVLFAGTLEFVADASLNFVQPTACSRGRSRLDTSLSFASKQETVDWNSVLPSPTPSPTRNLNTLQRFWFLNGTCETFSILAGQYFQQNDTYLYFAVPMKLCLMDRITATVRDETLVIADSFVPAGFGGSHRLDLSRDIVVTTISSGNVGLFCAKRSYITGDYFYLSYSRRFWSIYLYGDFHSPKFCTGPHGINPKTIAAGSVSSDLNVSDPGAVEGLPYSPKPKPFSINFINRADWSCYEYANTNAVSSSTLEVRDEELFSVNSSLQFGKGRLVVAVSEKLSKFSYEVSALYGTAHQWQEFFTHMVLEAKSFLLGGPVEFRPKPTKAPHRPTRRPTRHPTKRPTHRPTRKPTRRPTRVPTPKPSRKPTRKPTKRPTVIPTIRPTHHPTRRTKSPTAQPTVLRTSRPTHRPTFKPSTSKPSTFKPSTWPTVLPTAAPLSLPTTTPLPALNNLGIVNITNDQ